MPLLKGEVEGENGGSIEMHPLLLLRISHAPGSLIWIVVRRLIWPLPWVGFFPRKVSLVSERGKSWVLALILGLNMMYALFLIRLEKISHRVRESMFLNLLVTYPVNIALSIYITKFFDFHGPIKQQAARHDDKRTHFFFRIDNGQHGNRLQCFAQTHIVGQTAAQGEFMQIVDSPPGA